MEETFERFINKRKQRLEYEIKENLKEENKILRDRDKRIEDEKIEEIAWEIANTKEFNEEKNNPLRNRISDKLIKEKYNYNDSEQIFWRIKNQAELLYIKEIKPLQDEEIKKQILKLKSDGLKKVEIVSKLNLSNGMVDKYYHQ